MNKRQFENFIIKNIDRVEGVYCYIVEGFGIDNKVCCWLDIYIKLNRVGLYEDNIVKVYCSEDFDINSRAIDSLQRKWEKKINSWMNPNWGIEFICDKVYI